MQRAAHTVSGSSVAALLHYVKQHDASLDDEAAALGLQLSTLAAPETRVAQTVNDALWERAAALLDDDALGLHLAERLDLDAFHVVGHVAASSANLGEAVDRVVALSRLLHDAGRTELERRGDEAWIFPGCRGLPEPPPRHIAEFSAASVVLLARLITGAPCVPLSVRFHHGPAAAAQATAVRVFGVRPTHHAAESAVVLPASALSLPVKGPRSAVGTWLMGYAQELLARLPPDDSLEAGVVRAIVVGIASGGAEIEGVAKGLGLSPRTLQRRLAAAGTSFAKLTDEARRQSALSLLADLRLPLAEVGFLLGFGEPSAFHRAFRRWTGTTPGAWRAAETAERGRNPGP